MSRTTSRLMWRERIMLIEFQHVDVLKLKEYEMEAGIGRLGMSVSS